MGYRLRLRFDFITPTQPDVRGHWSKRSKHRREVRQMVVAAVQDAGGPPDEPLENARLILTRYSSSEPDEDGLAYSFKSIVDGLRAVRLTKKGTPARGDGPLTCAGVIADDTRGHIDRLHDWRRAPRGEGFMVVEVEG